MTRRYSGDEHHPKNELYEDFKYRMIDNNMTITQFVRMVLEILADLLENAEED